MQLGTCDWKTMARGQERCFLLTNGLGGYSSLTVLNSNNRNDHALMMGAVKAPNYRYHYVTNLQEAVEIMDTDGQKRYELSTQEYVNRTKNQAGYEFLQMMTYDELPEWTYQVPGMTIRKELVMVHGENTIGIRYRIRNISGETAKLLLRPLLRFTKKDEQIRQGQEFHVEEHCIRSDGQSLFFYTNGAVQKDEKTEYVTDLYYEYDARDGRDCVGSAAMNHTIEFELGAESSVQEFYLIYSDHGFSEPVDSSVIGQMIATEQQRQRELVAQAALQDPVACRLVRSADQFLSYRESTDGDTILAGYPFFSDWGRDTCIAVIGCTIATRQFDRTRSILRTFAAYCRNGVMPNLFPEGQNEPMYNTADASLLFIEAVYQYYLASQDLDFIKEMYTCMKEIITCYRQGTENHIYMDVDGLIAAGEGLEQVTWMDVRIGDILPTPRHGKPVEINAYWYNALRIMAELEEKLGQGDGSSYLELSEKVKLSFLKKFWMEEKGCLKDVLSGGADEDQIRCNQVWALSLSYCMLDRNMSEQILTVIERELYTPYGLRSLSQNDPQFHPVCKGSQWNRDIAYHQGTVWVFPLGAYYLAKLRWLPEEDFFARAEALQEIHHQLRGFETCLMEGCIGQVAEIYDGLVPTESRGCYAQAWSVGEMLRVYRRIEELEKELLGRKES